jgi:hypothetical protein
MTNELRHAMTSEEAIAALRRLIRERNSGTLSIADYRHRRARLLDALVGMEPSGADGDPTRPRPRGGPAPAMGVSHSVSRRAAAWRVAVAAAIVMILIGAICWHFFTRGSGGPSSIRSTSDSGSVAAASSHKI